MSKYDKFLDKTPKSYSSIWNAELEAYDWCSHTQPDYTKVKSRSIVVNMDESTVERWNRMLKPLNDTCKACTMCELGWEPATIDNEIRDPHVLSNMNPSRFIVVGQNPGANEVKLGMPFVGQSGANFDEEIAKNGLSRKDFYICNTVRCYTNGNTKPTEKHKQRCEPFLRMEINLLKPLLVITLGQVAFSQFCPAAKYGDSLCKITKSEKFDVNVFAVYHPSPLNINDPERRKEFNHQIKVMCALIKKLQTSV